MDHSEAGKAPRKQGHHQLRRYQQCGASVGNRALTPAASPLHLTIPVAVVATSQRFYLMIEGSASLLELTRGSAVQTSEHFASLVAHGHGEGRWNGDGAPSVGVGRRRGRTGQGARGEGWGVGLGPREGSSPREMSSTAVKQRRGGGAGRTLYAAEADDREGGVECGSLVGSRDRKSVV